MIMGILLTIIFLLLYISWVVIYTGVLNASLNAATDSEMKELVKELDDIIVSRRCVPLKWKNYVLFIFKGVRNESLIDIDRLKDIIEKTESAILFKLFTNKLYFAAKLKQDV